MWRNFACFVCLQLTSLPHICSGGSASKADQVRSQVEDVKNVMAENIDSMLERGQKLDVLVERAGEFSAELVIHAGGVDIRVD